MRGQDPLFGSSGWSACALDRRAVAGHLALCAGFAASTGRMIEVYMRQVDS